MTDDTYALADWGITPTRRERRAEHPPEHSDTPRPVLTLAQARRMARDRLADWRADHE